MGTQLVLKLAASPFIPRPRLFREFTDWIREQRKFNGLDALKARITEDIAMIVDRAELKPQLPIAALA